MRPARRFVDEECAGIPGPCLLTPSHRVLVASGRASERSPFPRLVNHAELHRHKLLSPWLSEIRKHALNIGLRYHVAI
jgi:hypothetical protein